MVFMKTGIISNGFINHDERRNEYILTKRWHRLPLIRPCTLLTYLPILHTVHERVPFFPPGLQEILKKTFVEVYGAAY
jgi:hypothetical protein